MQSDKENINLKRKELSHQQESEPIKKKQKKSNCIEFKGNNLCCKQKALGLSKFTSTIQKIVEFHDYLSNLNQSLQSIPNDHLPLISTLSHESERSLTDLAKHIKKIIQPGGNKDTVKLEVIEEAINKVSNVVNYGLNELDLPQDFQSYSIPNNLKVLIWEAKDFNSLPSDIIEKSVQRQNDRIESQRELRSHIQTLSPEILKSLLEDNESDVSNLVKAPPTQAPASRPKAVPVRNDIPPSTTPKKSPKKPKTPIDPEKLAEREKKVAEKEKKAQEVAARKAERENEKAEKDEKDKKIQAAKEKQSSAFKGFFAKSTPKKASPKKDENFTKNDYDKTFKPFHVKAGTTMAPINKLKPKPLDDDEWKKYIMSDYNDENITIKSIVNSIPHYKKIKKNAAIAQKDAPKGTKIAPPFDLRSAMHQLGEAEVSGDEKIAKHILETIKTRCKGNIRDKILVFHEDYRPGWLGTCTKSSTVIGPRRPFAKDNLQFDYSYDSEAEWEEDPEDAGAEEIASNGGGSDDEKDKDGNESDADSWLVSDSEDVGGEIDGMDLDNLEPPPIHESEDPIEKALAAEKRHERAMAKKKQEKQQQRSQKKGPQTPVAPFISGIKWEGQNGEIEYQPFVSYKIKYFNDADVNVNPLNFVSTYKPTLVTQKTADNPSSTETEPQREQQNQNQDDQQNNNNNNNNKAPKIPKTHIPIFIQVVENSSRSRVLLIEELREKFSQVDGPHVTKSTLDNMLKSYARRDGRKVDSVWHVTDQLKSMI